MAISPPEGFTLTTPPSSTPPEGFNLLNKPAIERPLIHGGMIFALWMFLTGCY
jgi:hypothetical protein